MASSLAPHRNLIAVAVVAVAVLVSTGIIIHNTRADVSGSAGIVEGTGTQDLLQIGGSDNTQWQQTLIDGIYGTSTDATSSDDTSLAGTSSEPGTLTDALAEDLLSQFSAMQASGDVSSDNEDQIVDNLLTTYDPGNSEPVYGMKDIIISPDSSAEAIKQYANTFASIEKVRIGLMVASLSANPNASEISATYVQIAADLKQVAVPAPLAQIHLDAINNYEKIATSLSDVVNYESDPTKGLFALKEYQDANTERQAIYSEFAAYLQENGILFSENEPGYAWVAFETNDTSGSTDTSSQNTDQNADQGDQSTQSQ